MEDKKIILKQEKEKSENNYVRDEQEWGLKEDYEKIEWEQYYESRSKRLQNGES